MTKRRVIVVGAGAAGLMAAGQAAGFGAETFLLEKTSHPAQKLRITGNGRCNLTNTAELSEFIKHFRPDGRFLRQAFTKFFAPHLIAFFEKLNVSTITEQNGCIFPAGGKAQDVIGVLLRYAKRNGVTICTDSPVRKLITESGKITGVQIQPDKSCSAPRILNADAVIIATGGASYPDTGSTGDGYRLAESLGHTIIPVRPALIPLETAGGIAQRLQGVSLSNVVIRVFVDGKKAVQASGEMLFTHFGLSGPAILNLSGQIVDWLIQKKSVSISIDLQPTLDDRSLDETLLKSLHLHGRQQISNILKPLLAQKLIPVCTDLTNIPAQKTGSHITAEERRRLRLWLKDFRLDITGHLPIAQAIVTAGGVSTREIDPRTMASRLIKGLYFAGEVIDIDGQTGGFNLQAAFSTGFLAAHAAANPNVL